MNVKEQLVKQNERYTYDIVVKGKHATIKVNDKVAVDWEQPAHWKVGEAFMRILDNRTSPHRAIYLEERRPLQEHPREAVRLNLRVAR